MVRKRKRGIENCELQNCSRLCEKIRARTLVVVLNEDKEFLISGKQKKKKTSVREETNAVSGHDGHERAKSTPKTAPSCESPTQKR